MVLNTMRKVNSVWCVIHFLRAIDMSLLLKQGGQGVAHANKNIYSALKPVLLLVNVSLFFKNHPSFQETIFLYVKCIQPFNSHQTMHNVGH